MDDELRRKLELLHQLTARQRQVFLLLCRGLPRKEIAARLKAKVRLVDSDIVTIIRKLEVDDPDDPKLTATQRRLQLRKLYRALEYLEAAEAPAAPEPSTEPTLTDALAVQPAAVEQFVVEAASVDPPMGTEAPSSRRDSPADGGGAPDPAFGRMAKSQPAGRRWLPSLALVVAWTTIVALVGGAIGYHAGAAVQMPPGEGDVRAPAVPSLPAGMSAVAPLPSRTSADLTTAVSTTDRPSSPVATAAEATMASASLQESPSPLAATPTPAPVSLAGKVASDIPGTPLALGSAAASVVDATTKRFDVYAITLAAGQVLSVEVTANKSAYSVWLADPDALPFQGRESSLQGSSLCNYQRLCQATFPVAVSGRYFVVVAAGEAGIGYTLRPSIVPNEAHAGIANLAGKVANDIPGSRLAVGATVTSIIDAHTKGFDVFAVPLSAGQNLRVDATANSDAYAVALEAPGSKPFEQRPSVIEGPVLCDYVRSCAQTFPVAVSGTYYVIVEAKDSGVQYTLRVTAS